MAHFAILNDNDIVIDVITLSNESILDASGNENEEIAKERLKETLEIFYPDIKKSQIVQTSINNRIRKRYAGIGFSYNRDLDFFIQPKPYESWILNKETLSWEAPIPYPGSEKEGDKYHWDEKEKKWIEIKVLLESFKSE